MAFDRASFAGGIRSALPLAVPPIPFGLVLGFLINQSPAVDNLAGWSASWIVFAGSSQLAAVELIDDGASALVVIFTVFLINSRHLMYSAAMNPRFDGAPRWTRLVGSYLLTDQVFAIADTRPKSQPLGTRMWHYLGSGVVFFVVWQVAVGTGLALGNVIPESWSLTFSVPLLFGGLMVLSIKDSPGVIAAVVAGVIALFGRDLPQGLGLLVAIIVGVAAGAFAESLLKNGNDSNDHAAGGQETA